MPQIATKPMPARKPIDAGIPPNLTPQQRAELDAKWDKAAAERKESVLRETKLPTEPSAILKYQLRRFGKWWMAYTTDKKGKLVPLTAAPSLLETALDAVADAMSREALKS